MEKQLDFYEIYDYYYQPIWQRGYFKLAITVLIITLLFLVGFFAVRYFLRKRRDKKMLSWEWAQRELNKLSVEKCVKKSDYKKFYFDLTLILKQYFNRRYDWQTQDKTDEELQKYLEDKNFDTVLLEGLKKLLSGALWIKFADESALKIEAEKDLKIAREIIDKTKQVG